VQHTDRQQSDLSSEAGTIAEIVKKSMKLFMITLDAKTFAADNRLVNKVDCI